jgi:hypothetical protein
VIWIDGIEYVVSPLDGINGAHPAFIVPEQLIWFCRAGLNCRQHFPKLVRAGKHLDSMA